MISRVFLLAAGAALASAQDHVFAPGSTAPHCTLAADGRIVIQLIQGQHTSFKCTKASGSCSCTQHAYHSQGCMQIVDNDASQTYQASAANTCPNGGVVTASPTATPTAAPTADPFNGRMVVIGNPTWLDDYTPEAYPVCLDRSSTQSPFNSPYNGQDIGVQCCRTDGVSGKRTAPGYGCTKAKTYEEAEAICAAYPTVTVGVNEVGYGLCTKSQVETGVPMGATTGCQYDSTHVWTTEVCPLKHWAVKGRGAAGNSDHESCQFNSETTETLSGVRCCKGSGNNVDAESDLGPDDTCYQGVTFETAKRVCETSEINGSNGWRLCTRAEIKANTAAGTGCGHDNRKVWTSDSCSE